ncbi:helix-turn-helix domain-containing protein [Chromobacterium amazonense]|uniref:AraC family transcriptional regulator n=1 Tax=Chromobacterium amazonense TaxID=1382803 RepID=A0A2S9X1Y3_9NEIS|nr:AraC family transcriptional regulator [Chromobacterium amazonense]MBM2883582.1 helix-turn-helix transcriptional regulator [Chromobacterium amazonense]MDQ4541164.1 AraC family transcriptional regulator [Chromobacterium amazonense]PRP69734.1 hypothetical protein BUE93_13645 [Chromobacterium amazonense]
MFSLHIILAPQAGALRLDGNDTAAERPGLWLMAGGGELELPASARCYSFPASCLQPVYREMQPLLADHGGCAAPNTPYAVPADEGLLHAVAQLADVDDETMLRFVLAYCLAIDGDRCAALLRYLVAADIDLFDFIHRHRLEPWPIARYADALGLPPRKFNQLFKEKFGMSAKHWLLAQRLEHARGLLETTTKKVIDVALESGFCNAAHFSDSFRRHFQMSPSDVRRESLPLTLAPSLLF